MSVRTSLVVVALAAFALVLSGCSGSHSKCVAKCGGSSLPPQHDAAADSAPKCPATEPAEGSNCTEPGLSCLQYGSLSCPETATCDSSSSQWRITCPKTAFGSDAMTCGCPHPGG